MNLILEKLIATTYTKRDLSHRVNMLRSYLINKYFTNEQQIDQPVDQPTFLKTLSTQFIQSFNQNNIYQLFDEAQKEINELNPLVVYLPIDLPDEEISRLGLWLRERFGQNFIFEIRFDPSLIGGCALIWKGVYKDYSLKGRINQKREEILASLKTFLKPGGS